MKKRFLLIGMIASMLVLSACGKETVYTEKQQQLINEVASASDEFIAAAEEASSYQEYIDMYNAGDEDLPAELKTWIETKEVIGNLTNVKDKKIEFDEKKNTVVVTSTIEGTKLAPDGNVRTAEVIYTYEKKDNKVSILSNVNYTFGELMEKAGLNTLLGMGTVFTVLILIMFVIMLFEIPSKMQAKKKTEEQPATSVDKAVEQITANEEAQDDTELIAVISAAIAAYEGSNASGDGYVVRSIRRIR